MNTKSQQVIQQLREQLDDEREKVVLATQMVHVESKRANTTERTLEAAYQTHISNLNRVETEYLRELDKKLGQINAQAGTIKEMVEALKDLRDHISDTYEDYEAYARCVARQTLSKLGYPLPAGRTK